MAHRSSTDSRKDDGSLSAPHTRHCFSSRRQGALHQHRPRCRKQAEDARPWTGRQDIIAASKTIYNSTSALPTAASLIWPSEHDAAAEVRSHDVEHRTTLRSHDAAEIRPADVRPLLSMESYHDRAMEERAAKPRPSFVVPGKTKPPGPVPPPSTRATKQRNGEPLSTSQVALRCGVHGRARPSSPWLPSRATAAKADSDEAGGAVDEKEGDGQPLHLRSDRLRYRSMEPRAIMENEPMVLSAAAIAEDVACLSEQQQQQQQQERRRPSSVPLRNSQQARHARRLSVPRAVTPKAVTDGVGKTVSSASIRLAGK